MWYLYLKLKIKIMNKKLPKETQMQMVNADLADKISKVVNGDKSFYVQDIVDILKANKAGTVKAISEKLLIPLFTFINNLTDMMQDDISTSFSSGMFLQDEAFIPEYVGFEERVIEQDGFKIRTYRRDDFMVMRNYFENIESGKDKWVVTKNVGSETEGQSTSVHTFDNMLEAVITLKSLGLKVTILDIVTNKYVS